MRENTTRRQALIAGGAVTATCIGAITTAGEESRKTDADSKKNAPLKLRICLTDGQVVTLQAAELIIDFDAGGRLLVTTDGILPVRDRQPPFPNSGPSIQSNR